MNEIFKYKKIAYNNIKRNSNSKENLESFICKWWMRKYNIPKTDKRYLDMIFEDIAIEYFEDMFVNDNKMLEAYEQGYESPQEMQEAIAKRDMGDEYTDEVAYYDEDFKNEEELVEDFTKGGV